jgi:DNA-3-methyladenine glycosylase II
VPRWPAENANTDGHANDGVVMKLQVEPMPPFDFSLTAMIFSSGDGQICRYENGGYWQVVRVCGKLILMIVTSSGVVEEPRLSVELKSDRLISSADRRVIVETVRSLFNLGLDLDRFYEDVKTDETMFSLAQKLRGLRSPSTASVFEALVDSIIEQQISLSVAQVLERNVVKAFGEVLKIEDGVYYAFPTPKSLATASVERLRRCGLSLRKAEYIKNVSVLVERGDLDLEMLKDRGETDEMVCELDKVRGIGIWTAELTILRGMHKFEVIPADDLGLRRCISHFYRHDSKTSGNQARKIAEKWGRWKGLASFYLIVANNLGIEV